MMPRIERNRSQRDDVCAHLGACAASFTPHLDERIVIAEYASKIVSCAERFEVWEAGQLIGLVAMYCNDPARLRAFVTNVSVIPTRTRSGLGRHLLQAAIHHASMSGFQNVALSADRNAAALPLYKSLGFVVEGRSGPNLHMSLKLLREPDSRTQATVLGEQMHEASSLAGAQRESRNPALRSDSTPYAQNDDVR